MKTFKQYLSEDMNDISLNELLQTDINEIAIRPTTARAISVALIARILNQRKDVQSAPDLETKIDRVADLIASTSYLSILQIATDQNDINLIRRIPRR